MWNSHFSLVDILLIVRNILWNFRQGIIGCVKLECCQADYFELDLKIEDEGIIELSRWKKMFKAHCDHFE